MLAPKLGLLSMLVDAYLESREEDAIFLPCHISYERVIEASSYVGELAGKAKQKESAGPRRGRGSPSPIKTCLRVQASGVTRRNGDRPTAWS